MLRAAGFLIGFFAFVLAVSAEDAELVSACVQSEAGNAQECACFAEKLGARINDQERLFALAILTEDETKLDPIRGQFTNEDAQAMQGKTMSAMIACMSG